MAAQGEIDMAVRLVVKHTFLAVAEEEFESEEGDHPIRRTSRARTAPPINGLALLDFLSSDEESEEEHEATWKASEIDLSTPTSSYWCGSPTSQESFAVDNVRSESTPPSSPIASDGQKWKVNIAEPQPQPGIMQNALNFTMLVFPGFPYPGGMSMAPYVWLLGPPSKPSSPDSAVASQASAKAAKPACGREGGDFGCGDKPAPKAKNARRQQESQSKTTLMIRNIPNNLSRQMFMELLDDQGFSCAYDFLYLPMDFHRRAGFGYAFVNCVNSREAQRMLAHFQGFNGWSWSSSHKVSEAIWCSPSQGYASQVQRFRNNPVMHPSVPDEFKPIVLKDGVRKDFPPPTVSIQPPANMI